MHDADLTYAWSSGSKSGVACLDSDWAADQCLQITKESVSKVNCADRGAVRTQMAIIGAVDVSYCREGGIAHRVRHFTVCTLAGNQELEEEQKASGPDWSDRQAGGPRKRLAPWRFTTGTPASNSPTRGEDVGPDRVQMMVFAAITATVPIVMCAVIIVTSRRAASGKLARNHYVGIRTPSTMRSDAAWVAGHRAATRLSPAVLVITAIVCAAVLWAALYASSPGVVITVGLGGSPSLSSP